jgi:hypothetical protein
MCRTCPSWASSVRACCQGWATAVCECVHMLAMDGGHGARTRPRRGRGQGPGCRGRRHPTRTRPACVRRRRRRGRTPHGTCWALQTPWTRWRLGWSTVEGRHRKGQERAGKEGGRAMVTSFPAELLQAGRVHTPARREGAHGSSTWWRWCVCVNVNVNVFSLGLSNATEC